MMGRPERPAVGERTALNLASDRRDHRDFEQFRRGEWGQNCRQPGRKHRLPRAGRADHEEVVDN